MRERSVKCALWLRSQNVSSGEIITVLPCKSMDFYVPFLAGLYINAIVNLWDVECKLNLDVLRRTRPKVVFADKKHVLQMYALKGLLLREKFLTTIIVFQPQRDFITIDSILDSFNDINVERFTCSPMRRSVDTALILRTFNMMTVEKNIEIPYAAFLNTFYANFEFFRDEQIGLWHANLGSYQELFLFVNAIYYHAPLIVWWRKAYLALYKAMRTFEVHWTHFNYVDAKEWYNIVNSLNRINKLQIPKFEYLLYTYDTRHIMPCELFVYNLPNIEVYVIYLYPEIGPIACGSNVQESIYAGTIMDGVDIKLVTHYNETVDAIGVVGEICCKSRILMNGYYQQNIITRSAIDKEGWLRTKDIGYYDICNELHVIGFGESTVMKYRDEIIETKEIEDFLRNTVAKSICILPVLHEVDGYHPFAFIVKSKYLWKHKVQQVTKKLVQTLVEKNFKDSHKLRGGIMFLKKMKWYGQTINIKQLYWILDKYVQKESLCYDDKIA